VRRSYFVRAQRLGDFVPYSREFLHTFIYTPSSSPAFLLFLPFLYPLRRAYKSSTQLTFAAQYLASSIGQRRAQMSPVTDWVRRETDVVYGYPPSPPSSATVTSPPSPQSDQLAPVAADPPMPSPAILHKAISNRVEGQAGEAQAPSEPDGEDSIADTGGQGQTSLTFSAELVPKRAVRHRHPRALTMPAAMQDAQTYHITSRSEDSPSTRRRRAFLRRNSSAGSSSRSSSSPSTMEELDPTQPIASTSGLGRKVADSLQLFRESTTASATSPTAESAQATEPPRPISTPAKRRKDPVAHTVDDVTAAEFEFVKRADWPEREAAAIRREKSTHALEKVRTRESTSTHPSSSSQHAHVEDGQLPPSRRRRTSPTLRDNGIHDLYQWRQDVVSLQETAESERGRRRLRHTPSQRPEPTFQVGSSDSESVTSGAPTVHDVPLDTPVITRSRSKNYPISPSPSRPPLDRVPSTEPTPIAPVLERIPSKPSRPTITTPSHPTPQHDILPTPAISRRGDSSPWSSEDESGWDSMSNATTASKQSNWSLPSPHLWDHAGPPPPFTHRKDDHELPDSFLSSQEYDPMGQLATPPSPSNVPPELPHIPLQPFRNQVGGHSAIYKFTKRAVCKVRSSFQFVLLFQLCLIHFSSFLPIIYSRLYRVRTFSMSPLSSKHRPSSGSSHDTWASCLSTIDASRTANLPPMTPPRPTPQRLIDHKEIP
jgi:inositol-hexakisphosphate kinase